ncbi:MAG: hypothetical protein ACOCYN_04435 [Planctomycetota bacterium]
MSSYDTDDLQQLATGFALGELDDADLQRLYDLLRARQDSGREAALVVWQTLATTLDLRTAFGAPFPEAVELALREREPAPTHGADTPPQRGFLERFLGVFGVERPRLDQVDAPPPHPRRAWRSLHLLVVMAVLLGAAVMLWRSLTAAEPAVVVATAQGRCEAEDGAALQAGQSVDQRQIALGDGARLALRWRTGNQAIIDGPATAAPLSAGLSLPRGNARLALNTAFTLGLPDARLACAPGSRLAVTVADGRSVAGLAAGSAQLIAGGQTHELAPGQASDGATVFPWIRAGGADELQDGALPPAWRAATVWELRFTAAAAGPGDAVLLQTDEGVWLRITAGLVELRATPDAPPPVGLPLPGPPRLAHTYRLVRRGPGAPQLELDGRRLEPRLLGEHPPLRVVVQGAATLTGLAFISGPGVSTTAQEQP